MKKIFYSIVALAMVAACSKEAAVDSGSDAVNGDEIRYTFGINVQDTKLVYADNSIMWTDGDEISIGWHNKTNDKTGQINVRVNVDGDKASVSFTMSADYEITGAWYPKGGKKLESNAFDTQYDDRGRILIPYAAEYDGSQTTLEFLPVVSDWSLIKYSFVKGNAEKTITDLAAVIDGKTYKRTGMNLALSEDVQEVYLAIPASAEAKALKTVVTTSDGLTYTRTKKTFTATAKTVTSMPAISDIDNTGRHIWYMGVGETNEAEAPLQYWFRSSTRTLGSGIIDRHEGYMTVTTELQKNSKYRADIAPLSWSNHAYYSSDGAKVTNQDNLRLVVHAGNYPIFAVKMTNLDKAFGEAGTTGTKWNLKVDTNSKVEEENGMPVRYFGNIGNTNYPKYSIAVDDNTVVYYFDLATQNLKNGNNKDSWELVPDSRALKFYGWQVQVPDIVADVAGPAPTYDVYWAGFFNSKAELETFIQNN